MFSKNLKEASDSNSPWIKTKFEMNRKLLPLKFHYFIYFAAIACVLPFRTIFARQLGVSGTEIGIVFAVVPPVKFFSEPIFGAIMDRFKAFHTILYGLLIIVATSHLSLTFIPNQESPSNFMDNGNLSSTFFYDNGIEYEELLFQRNSTFVENIHGCDINCDQIIDFNFRNDSYLHCIWRDDKLLNSNVSNLRCGVIAVGTITYKEKVMSLYGCDEVLALSIPSHHPPDLVAPNINSCLNNASFQCLSQLCRISDMEFSGNNSTAESLHIPFVSLQFWLFLLLMILSNTSFCAVIFLVDVVCYEILDDEPEKYGRQRLFGAIGWGIGSLLAGYFNQLFTGDSEIIDYRPCFYLLIALILIDFIPLYYTKVENVKFSKNIMKDVMRLIKHPDVLMYFVIVFCIGMLSGLMWNYEFWYLEELHASQILLGLTQTVQCFFSEVPCFFVAGWVCKKVGYGHCNSLTLLFFFLRYAVYVPMTDPWLSLPAGLLHGPTFGLFFASITCFAKEKALPGTEATIQAILSVVFEATGVATGSIIGGVGVDKVGSRRTFLYAAIFSLSLLIINVVFEVVRNATQKGMQKKKDITKNMNLQNLNTKL